MGNKVIASWRIIIKVLSVEDTYLGCVHGQTLNGHNMQHSGHVGQLILLKLKNGRNSGQLR